MTMQRVNGRLNTEAVLKSLASKNAIVLSEDGITSLVTELADRIMIGAEGAVTFETEAGERDVIGYIAELAATRAARHLFVSPAQGTTSVDYDRNPWSDEFWNATTQHRIERFDPAVAERMETAATRAKHGLQGGDPSNPYSRAGHNLTQQMLLENTNPTRAAELQALAQR
jgi:hypothetical protein